MEQQYNLDELVDRFVGAGRAFFELDLTKLEKKDIHTLAGTKIKVGTFFMILYLRDLV